MFDFGAAHRAEGDKPGVNDKGLVTADRQTKKDAYYFYKANWNPEPRLYLSEKRYKERIRPETKIKAYTNLDQVTFYHNNKKVATVEQQDGIALSPIINLDPGENIIEIRGKVKGKPFSDRAVWTLKQ